jgi:acyl-homoserine-lactone acylase
LCFWSKKQSSDLNSWQKQAKNVVITRDNWGIAHIVGKTDADAVFGMMYAQCEDDFDRIEMNYIEKLGRLSELSGDKNIYNDLQIKLLIDIEAAKKDYFLAEPWLKNLLNAYAAGINFFLLKNPEIKPKLLRKFEPWFPLLWTDGSIGAISTAELTVLDLKEFYSGEKNVGSTSLNEDYEQTGSNGFAIAPQLNTNGKAMLYINPHTTFYFRPEIHVKSNAGLNAYGAVTWGQFFVYQGFNENCGWMHTSSNADVADTFYEKITEKAGKYFYEYDKKLKPVEVKTIKIKYKEGKDVKTKVFRTYHTQNGPIMAIKGNKWISLKSFNRSAVSLKQSWLRTKANGFDAYKEVMNLKANTSNNTVFADKNGNIAYWHGNYMPVRNQKLNWSKTQDGSVTANAYSGLHKVEETVHVYNPINGWIQNCNSTAYTAADTNSPKKTDYPAYMAPDGENFRGINAARLLRKATNLDLDKLIALGYDNYLVAFEILIPEFISKTKSKANDETKEAIEILEKWDFRANKNSIATTLAIEWAQKLNPIIKKVYIDEGETDQIENTKAFIKNANAEELLKPLEEVIKTLKTNYGTWKVTWGEINRFQRLNNQIETQVDDKAESIATGNASALWGCLPSFTSKYYGSSMKRYGYNGNSFVCAVEFGDKIKAKSLLAGGNSGSISSKNFIDQAQMYVDGKFKDVLFYEEDIKKNAVKTYSPGFEKK